MLFLYVFGAQAAVQGAAEPELGRLAIVIGNSNYASERYGDLSNAANDARRLSESLKRLNFEVITGVDLAASDFDAAFRQAQERLGSYEAVLIFYAGHGVQIKGENYLLPVDAMDPSDVASLTERAVKLNDIVARFASRSRQTFIFLDACRNNPLGTAEDARDGLAQVEVGENTFIAFATQPGNVTVDGTGENSPFTTALLKSMETPGLSISDMMIRVRTETEAQTFGRQVPWDQSNLLAQFYFTERQAIAPTVLGDDLSRILADPKMKERLIVELASNDLQTAVLIVGEQLRSVEVSPPPVAASSAAEVTAGGQQVASLSPMPDTNGMRASVVSGIETLIVGTPAGSDDAAPGIDLARSVQTELRRLGCYRMTVDGDWGKGSVRALKDYYRSTQQAEASLEPGADLLGELFLRSGRTCKQPVVRPPSVKNDVATTGSRQSPAAAPGTRRANTPPRGRQQVATTESRRQPAVAAGSRRGNNVGRAAASPRAPRSPVARRPPAAPPPDISAGIGIGGVF